MTAEIEAIFLAALRRRMVTNLKGGGFFLLTLPNDRKVLVVSTFSIGSMMGSPLPSARMKVTHLFNMHDLMNLVQLLQGIKVQTTSVFLDIIHSNFDVVRLEGDGYDRYESKSYSSIYWSQLFIDHPAEYAQRMRTLQEASQAQLCI